jgi:hypothetical protein
MKKTKRKDHKKEESKIFGRAVVASLTFLIVFSFFFSISHRLVVFKSDFLANILPRVVVDITNSYRTSSELSQLTINPVLEEAAKRKAEDMAQKGYFAHTSPEGITPWHWFEDVGYDFIYAGENLAIHFTDSNEVVSAWMDSPGHRNNILSQHFVEIGIATAKGMYQGRETTFVVQLFGHPSTVTAFNVPAQPVFAEEVEATETEKAPVVLAEESDASVEESEVSGVSEESKFEGIASVQNPESGDDIPTAPDSARASNASYSTLLERLILSPSLALSITYFALGGIVIFLLILALAIEIRKHHFLHVAYTAGLLSLILVLYLAYFGLNKVQVLSSFVF